MHMTSLLLILSSLLPLLTCLKFSYSLLPSQTQCFYQTIQKDSRYQIIIRSSSPLVSLTIFSITGTIATLNDPEIFEKSYAGFSDFNSQIHFCITNPSHQKSKSLIQLYHGSDLQVVKEVVDKTDFVMLKEANENLRKIVILLKKNFKFYTERMRTRVMKHQGVSWVYNIVTIVIIVLISVLSFWHVFSFRNFLRSKKYV